MCVVIGIICIIGREIDEKEAWFILPHWEWGFGSLFILDFRRLPEKGNLEKKFCSTRNQNWKCFYHLRGSVTKIGKILKVLSHFQHWLCDRQNSETTLVIFKSCRANVHLWNRPNIEQKIQPSGRTASKQKLVLLICTVWRIAEKFNLLKLKKFQHKTTPANNQNKNK